jgi:hypothetical protein
LTDPNTIPRLNYDPHFLPPTAGPAQVYASALQQVNSLAKNPFFGISAPFSSIVICLLSYRL